MTSRLRLTPDQRREVIVDAATRLTRDAGTLGWTRAMVVTKCVPPTSLGTIKRYFTMDDLRAAVRLRISQ